MGKHYATCPSCGFKVHISYYSKSMSEGMIPSGKCEKCGKRIYTTVFWEEED
ncbi:MAG: hypothetical protein WED04_07750 [Promethearchaeati archaeon SRVP18_Atabeyarchaeia-1]